MLTKQLSELLKTSGAYKALQRDCDGGNMAHAYLLLSSDGFALKMLANLFVAYIVGKDNALYYKRALDGSFLDVISLPSGESKKAEERLKTADADYIAETAYMTAVELENKFYILDLRESQEIVQNKLLKTLEDPPASAKFILLASTENELLPTVRSRCRSVQLQPFLAQDIVNALMPLHLDETLLNVAASQCMGQIGRVYQILSSGSNYIKLYETAASILKYMTHSSQVLKYAASLLAVKDSLSKVLDFMELLLRDAMVFGSGATQCLNMKNNTHDLMLIAKEYSPEVILRIFPLLQNARGRLKSGNINGIIDEMLFSILEVKAKCRK